MKTYEIGIDELLPDERNANKGTVQGKKALKSSVRELGIGRGIVADKNLRVIGGNKTRDAIQAAGLRKVIVVETEGDVLVVTKRTDLDLSERMGTGRKLAYADNRVQEMDYEIDPFLLNEDLQLGVVPDWLELTPEENIKTSDSTPVIGLAYKIVVTCNTEEEQQQLLTEMETRGLECKAVIV